MLVITCDLDAAGPVTAMILMIRSPMRDKIRIGFYLAAVVNLNIIWLSRGLSDSLGQVDPLFSSGGCFLVLVWGAAYFATARIYEYASLIVAVFAIEKAFYAGSWILWINEHKDRLEQLYSTDILAGFFFSIYGLVDTAFMLFFAWVAWRYRENFFWEMKKSEDV